MNHILEINISSLIFDPMLNDLDNEIRRVIEKIYDEEFESGEITLKLNLTQIDAYKEYPKQDEFGFEESEIYYYKKPQFKHSVSTSLKKQYKQQGELVPDAEIKLIDEQYLLVPVKDPQMSLLDREEDFLK